MRKFVAVALACLSVGACATASQDISAAYVSPARYSSLNCAQIGTEVNRVQLRVSELSGKQDKERQKDQAAAGVGLILFAPAALFMIGGDHKAEIAQLKGEHNALRDAAAAKSCPMAMSS